MKRRVKAGKKHKSVNMASGAEAFRKKAKKPENDDKPHVRPPSPRTASRAGASGRVKRLAGFLL